MRPSSRSCRARSSQSGRGQLPMPQAESGAMRAGPPCPVSRAGRSTDRGFVRGIAGPASGLPVTVAPATGGTKRLLEMRKLQRSAPGSCQVETSSLPVILHQAGRSSATEGSVERISSSCPAASGSILRRIWSRSPLPQSMSPPSNWSAGSWGWRFAASRSPSRMAVGSHRETGVRGWAGDNAGTAAPW